MAWMEEVNEILRPHRFRAGDYFIRFQATRFPKPTVSIVVYYQGRKVIEKPIRRLNELIEDLSDAKDVLRTVKVSPSRRRNRESNREPRRRSRERRRDDRYEEENEEAEDETENETEEEEIEEETNNEEIKRS